MAHRVATRIADNEAAHRAAFVVDLMANPIGEDTRQYLANVLRVRATSSHKELSRVDLILRLSRRIQQARRVA